ncbi:hypothetical protein GCM10009617_08480 [Leifsonia poae]|uniref:DUF1648 domain-containing protein n=2 Tax=Leifsonia poae TaxID=110933 RepID=A0A9W6LYN5_9MICO|nr:hypothetical protein GCM10017584_09470 [Leifsonia poae]
MSRGMGIRVGYAMATALTWVPAVVLVAAKLSWGGVPATVPVHWIGGGRADEFQSSITAFWLSLVPALVCAVIAVVVLVASHDARRIYGALGFGVLALVAAAASVQWLVDVLTALVAADGGDSRIGAPFLLQLASLAFGLLVFGVAMIGKRDRTPTRDASMTGETAAPTGVQSGA